VNNSINNKTDTIDILCVGEVLIDFIGHQEDVLINETRDYHRYLGGSPTNVAMNKIRINATMVAAVGDDGFDHIFSRNSRMLVYTSHITTLDNKSTSVIFVSRSEGTRFHTVQQIVVFMKNKFQRNII
jgi:fructokinase